MPKCLNDDIPFCFESLVSGLTLAAPDSTVAEMVSFEILNSALQYRSPSSQNVESTTLTAWREARTPNAARTFGCGEFKKPTEARRSDISA
jgi:hypothetical protein